MYAAIIILLSGIAAGLILWGIHQKTFYAVALGVILLGGTLLVFNFLSFWSDVLWFDSLGCANRFWKVIVYRALFAVLGGVIGFAVLGFLTRAVFEQKKGRIRWIPAVAGLYAGAKWGSLNWDTILLFFNGPTTGTQDPILKKDIGFYLFSLPFYEQVYLILFGFCIIGLLSVFAGLFITFKDGRIALKQPRLDDPHHTRRIHWVYLNASLFLFVLAWGRYLDHFHLLDSRDGVVWAAGWTDVHIAHTLEMTQQAYGLETAGEKQFPVSAIYPEPEIGRPRIYYGERTDSYNPVRPAEPYYAMWEQPQDPAETAAYPELRLVAVLHNDPLSYARRFDEALKGLFDDARPAKKPEASPKEISIDRLIEQADQAFHNYLQFSGEKEFQKASQELTRLQEALARLKESTLKERAVNQSED